MPIKKWFFNWLERSGRHRIIMDRTGKVPYMHRYYLLFKDKMNEFDESRNLPFNIMLHHIVLSDQDGFHDHPWWYFTLILKGGYWEHMPLKAGKEQIHFAKQPYRVWRGPGHFRISRPESLHKLELPYEGASAWTLFIKGPKVRDWGFIRPDGRWEYWRTYLQKRYGVQKAKLDIKFGEPENKQ